MMHGLVNRAIERFVRDTYGRDLWIAAIRKLDLGYTEFEAMLRYDAQITDDLLHELCNVLGRGRDELLEDVGTYLISNPAIQAPRRLMRFGGIDFVEFLHSLDELPERVRLAVADLDLPQLELHDQGTGTFSLMVAPPHDHDLRLGHVVMGVLRAMADDYGALAFLNYKGIRAGREVIEVQLLDEDYAAGRLFDLSLGGTGQ